MILCSGLASVVSLNGHLLRLIHQQRARCQLSGLVHFPLWYLCLLSKHVSSDKCKRKEPQSCPLLPDSSVDWIQRKRAVVKRWIHWGLSGWTRFQESWPWFNQGCISIGKSRLDRVYSVLEIWCIHTYKHLSFTEGEFTAFTSQERLVLPTSAALDPEAY